MKSSKLFHRTTATRLARFLAMLLAMLLLAAHAAQPASATATAFDDVPYSHWATDYINYATEHRLMNGMGGNRFAPDENLTEAQLCQIFYNAKGLTVVASDPWYAVAVGYIVRETDLSITPENPVTREFACRMLYALERDKVKLAEPTLENLTTFKDCDDLSLNSLRAIWFCKEVGLVAGFPDGSFRPNDVLSRAQGAKIITEAHQRFWGGYPIIPDEPLSSAYAISEYAETLGLATEVASLSPAPGSRTTYWWSNIVDSGAALYVYSPEGTYTFVTDGTWRCNTGTTWSPMTTSWLMQWLADLANRLTVKQKVDLVYDMMYRYITSNLGLSASETTIKVDGRTATGLRGIKIATRKGGRSSPVVLVMDCRDGALYYELQNGTNGTLLSQNITDSLSIRVWLTQYANGEIK